MEKNSVLLSIGIVDPAGVTVNNFLYGSHHKTIWKTLPARVMITCPCTHKQIYTGMNFDWPQFESVQIGERSTACPACGGEHSWTRADATLVADGAGD